MVGSPVHLLLPETAILRFAPRMCCRDRTSVASYNTPATPFGDSKQNTLSQAQLIQSQHRPPIILEDNKRVETHVAESSHVKRCKRTNIEISVSFDLIMTSIIQSDDESMCMSANRNGATPFTFGAALPPGCS